jgi:hypothetical protein
MRTVRIDGADAKPLGAPDDWRAEDGRCGELFIRRQTLGSVAFMQSAWEVEPTEAERLFAGAKIVLGVAGQMHPVVHMLVDGLPDDFDPVVTARRTTQPDGTPAVRVTMLFSHRGGRRGYATVTILTNLADAVAIGIEAIEGLAAQEGWTSPPTTSPNQGTPNGSA